MAEHKLDIFNAMAAVDQQDGGWFERQSEEAQKGLAAPVFLRWASAIAGDGIAGEYTLMMVNERLNVDADLIMTEYPDLFFRMAASCGIGQRARHEWVPMPGRTKVSNDAWDFIASIHPMANNSEIDIAFSQYTSETFKDLVDGAGLMPKDAKEIVQAYGKATKEPKNSKDKKAR